ncbi:MULTISPECIES: histidinol-phosphate transaminase [unclassified Curtobacterium]|uniref:histidinol-phosphate transaminase n=1 Tax=unclassified Curtobacterium TaxID=257496 RepID=UPI00089DE291|nr:MULTISPECIES: histidinol-phosphate transaminase [unclassified Curtobacterium]AOX64730.1 histidinol-phosphate transaminase [Curtobacterium sp. BH-2-1-1]MCC8908891.1 histidinol-phosphate transaminase [Curtobacterium sp. GD1]OII22637.1 histidinol-phosphate transaminase [Curtobacterium sp. MCBA15_016]
MAFTLEDLPIRDDLRGQSPYGAPQKHVRVQLNVNENTHPVPADVAEDIVSSIRQALTTVNRYPDREFTELRQSLADYLQRDLAPGQALGPEQIWAANGSNEVLQQLLQAFGGPGRTVLGFPPTYSMHSILASGTGTTWIPAQRDDEFRIAPETVVAAIREHQPDIVFLCGPNNPTGTPLPIETIEAAYAATDGIVMVDEAYAEFMPADAPSALTLLPGRERLIVSRTMSKAFAFAGARVGYMAAHPAVIDAIRLVRLPYHLSALTQAAAVAALRHAPAMLAMVDDITQQRDRMVTELRAMGYRTYETWSNFVLFGGVADPHAAFEALLEQDVIVRDLGIPNHLRVSAGTEEETTVFLDAMRRVAADQPPVRVAA